MDIEQYSNEINRKSRKIFKNPKFYLKDFLTYMGLMQSDSDINLVTHKWFKELIDWTISYTITGLILFCALFFLLSRNIRTMWIGFALAAYVIERTHRGWVNGRKEEARAK